MTSDAILVLQALFQIVWKLFTSWYIPGTRVTPAAMGFFLLTSVFVLRRLKEFFGGGGDSNG